MLRAERPDPASLLDCGAMNDPAIGETLVSSEDLQRRVAELGAQISEDYEGRDLVLVGVLKGAVLFLADLMRSIDVPCEIDFMAVSSYGSQTDSSGVVRILKDLDAPIEGRHVLIVEDIIDSGLTLQYLMRSLNAREPGLARGLRAADQAGAPPGRPLAALRRLRDPEPLRDRLRPRPRPALPQPRIRRRAGRDVSRSAGAKPPWYADFSLMRRFFKSAAFPILLVVILAFVAQRVISQRLRHRGARPTTN